jgi:hypothetical protein
VSSTFDRLREFIQTRMRMSRIYHQQSSVLMFGGTAAQKDSKRQSVRCTNASRLSLTRLSLPMTKKGRPSPSSPGMSRRAAGLSLAGGLKNTFKGGVRAAMPGGSRCLGRNGLCRGRQRPTARCGTAPGRSLRLKRLMSGHGCPAERHSQQTSKKQADPRAGARLPDRSRGT